MKRVCFVLLSFFCRNDTESEPLLILFEYHYDQIGFLEHVVARMSVTQTAGSRGDLHITLTSPSGTESILLDYRPLDEGKKYFNWPFMSVHFWGENPSGTWMLSIYSNTTHNTVLVDDLVVTFYGTASTPEAVAHIPEVCHPDCARGCAAAGSENCDACRILRNAHTLQCIDECPPGYTERSGYCYDITMPEPVCRRNVSTSLPDTGMG